MSVYARTADSVAGPLPRPLKPRSNAHMKPGRNDPCPCGSGKKYKHCHMQADEAPRPEDLTWRRLHRAIDGLAGQLLNVAMRHFGPEGIHEAWQEFNLWPEGEPEFDPEAADVTIFLPWFLYHWLPDSEDTQTPPGAQGTTVAKAYLAAAGDRVELRSTCRPPSASSFSMRSVPVAPGNYGSTLARAVPTCWRGRNSSAWPWWKRHA